jgi:outer membrane protein assembly factor BamB
MHTLLFASRRWILFASAYALALLVMALLLSGALTRGGMNPCDIGLNTNPPPAVSSILVQDGVVYAGAYAAPHDRSFIYAFDARRGTLFWRYEIVPSTWQPVVAAVAAGIVYVGVQTTPSGYDELSVLALRASDGQLLWNFKVGRISTLTLAVSGGIVYAAGNTLTDLGPLATLYALRTSDGTLLWQQSDMTDPFSLPTIAGQVAYVYTGDPNSSGYVSIYALRVSDGKVLWSHRWQTRYATDFAAPVVLGGVLYTNLEATGALDALRASDGAALWHAQVALGPLSIQMVANGLVYATAGTQNGTYTDLYALDASTGTTRWQFPSTSVPVLDGAADGLMYVRAPDSILSTRTGLFALDGVSGAIRWVRHADDRLLEVVNGVIYANEDSSSTMVALNAATGHVVWRSPAEVNSLPFAAGSGEVYFASEGYSVGPCSAQNPAGYLYALNARTGSPLWHYQTQG